MASDCKAEIITLLRSKPESLHQIEASGNVLLSYHMASLGQLDNLNTLTQLSITAMYCDECELATNELRRKYPQLDLLTTILSGSPEY